MLHSAVPTSPPRTGTLVRSAKPEHAHDPTDAEVLALAFAPARLSAAVLDHLADAARLVRCPAGSFELATPRRPAPSWWLVGRGLMGLGTRAADGSLAETRRIGTGEWLETAGAMSVPGGWLQHAWCHTPVALLAVPLVAMNEACAMDSAFPQAYTAVLARRVCALNDSLQILVSADVPGRLARWLLRRPPAFEQGGVATVVLTEPKQALARNLDTTSESLSRALRRLSDEGLVEVKRYEIALLDVAGLRRHAFPAVGSSSGRRALTQPSSLLEPNH